MQSNIVHRLLWGGVLIAVGVIFLLNQLGIPTISIADLFRNFWPIALILFGLQGVLIQRSGGFVWNMIVMLVGIVFLGRNLNWLEWEVGDIFRIIWPIAIILFGLSMIAKGSKTRLSKREELRRSQGWNPVTPPMPGQAEQPEWQTPPQGPPPAPPLSDDPNAPFSSPDGERDPRMQEPTNPSERASRQSEQPDHESPSPGAAGSSDDSWDRHRYREKMREERWREHRARHAQRRSYGGGNHTWWNYDPNATQHHRFIGDVHIGQDYWELQPMNISHFIGDTTIDLTKAQIPVGETKIYISCFIGDVKVFVPGDTSVGIRVVSSSLIGDVRVWDQKRGGLFNSMSVETPYYGDTDKQVVLVASAFIGDVRVTKVG